MGNHVGLIVNVFIGLLAVVAFYGLWTTKTKVIKLHEEMDADKRKTGGRKKYTEGGMQEEADVYRWEDNLRYLEKFNKIQLRYSVYEQLIPLFPLFGILGTVLGLFLQMGNITEMRNALSTSMTTTIVGLVATIILRIFDAFATSAKVNDLVLQFDLFERNYQMVKDKYELENK